MVASPSQFYKYTYDAPDAVVILNRGTQFEQDITGDVISFNTNNSVDSITGSFMLTVDNTNERYVDRWNFAKIKKMGSIEIFAKSLDIASATTGAGSADPTQTNPGADADSVFFPQEINGEEATLGALITQIYGKGISDKDRTKIMQTIPALNRNRSLPKRAFEINKFDAINNGTLKIKDITVRTSQKQIVITSKSKNVNAITIKVENFVEGKNTANLITFTMTKSEEQRVLQIPVPSNIIKKITTREKAPIPAGVTEAWPTDVFEDADERDLQRKPAIKIPRPPSLFPRIFFGVVLSVVQNMQIGGSMSLVLSGKSIGYWLEASKVNIFPAAMQSSYVDVDLTVYANRYTEFSALDIFKDLIRGSTEDLAGVIDYNADGDTTGWELLANQGKFDDTIIGAFNEPITFQDADGRAIKETKKLDNTSPASRERQLDTMGTNLYKGLPINVTGQNVTTNDNITKDPTWTRLAKELQTSETKLVKYKKDVTATRKTRKIKEQEVQANVSILGKDAVKAEKQKTAQILKPLKEKRDAEQKNVNELKKKIDERPIVKAQREALTANRIAVRQASAKALRVGRERLLQQFGIIEHWKKIFAQFILEVVNPDKFLSIIKPVKFQEGNHGVDMDGDYISKAELASQISEAIQHEFYCDTNGHFILKPPLYNVGVPDNNPVYIIEEDDLVSMSLNDTVEGIITRIGVTGDWQEAPEVMDKILTYNLFQDMRLIRDYGFHGKEIANRLFLRDVIDCRDFGKAFMSKNNQELVNATITIIGRPKIRLGLAVYLKPKDTVYYIKGISHELTSGGQYQTTLTLTGARRILTGFATRSKVNLMGRVFLGEESTSFQYEVKGEPVDIVHYTPTSSTNFELLDAHDNASKDFTIKKDKPPTEEDPAGRAEPRNPQEANTQGANGPNKPIRLVSVYQILNHPNPAMIGLIIDKDSQVISNANKSNFDFFNNLVPDDIPQKSLTSNNVPPKEKNAAVGKINEQFTNFTTNENITPENAGETFTPEKQNKFIFQALTNFSSTASAPSTTVRSLRDPAESVERRQSVYASRLLVLLTKVTDNNILYKQLTDEDGRELPAYLDYGKSLLIQQNEFKLNDFETISRDSNKKDLNENRKKSNATTAAGSNPRNSKLTTEEAKRIRDRFKIGFREATLTREDQQTDAEAALQQIKDNDANTDFGRIIG